MKKIGIDFGTSYTKIAYPDENGHPLLFCYPSEQSGKQYISTEISYVSSKNGVSKYAGPRAFAHINDAPDITDVPFFRDFKMYLPLDTKGLDQNIWNNGHSPVSVTIDYFAEILTSGRFSFVQKMGNFDQIIVSVPEVWYRDPANPGPDRLLDVFEKLGIPRENLQLQSEPVCAAAFYVYCQQQRSKENTAYNLLVCDMGGGTFDVALCRVENSYIRVLYHDGSGVPGIGSAGAAFDQACVNACLASVGKNPENDPADFYRLLHAFEEIKLTPPDETDDTIQNINEEFTKDILRGETPVYSFEGFEVTASHAWQAFRPIRNEIQNVIRRVHDTCSLNNWGIDQAVVVGGFGQYPLVRQTIYDCLPEIDRKISESKLSENERYYAIAKGAYYIVNDMIRVVEPFQHELGIIPNVKVDGIVRRQEIPIIQANQELAGMTTPRFATNINGKHIIVQIDGKSTEPMPVYVKPNGGEASRKLKPLNGWDWPQMGKYLVGFQIDRSNRATLIFKHHDQNLEFHYLVGESHFE